MNLEEEKIKSTPNWGKLCTDGWPEEMALYPVGVAATLPLPDE